MRNLILLFLTIPLLSFQPKVESFQIVGKWTGEDKSGDIGIFTFYDDGNASIEYDGVIVAGKEFDFNGKKAKLTYQFNDKKNPIELDFIFTILEDGSVEKSLGQVDIVDKNTMNMHKIYGSHEQPTKITKNAMVLKRVIE